MSEPRSCAYCGKPGPLTREHLWPAGIIQRAGVRYAYLGKQEKYVDAELKIKDVCGECNNGPLSALDSYACDLFDKQFSRQARKHESRNFVYDYESLLRWLLKISYNVARANDSDGPVLSPLKEFMIAGLGAPPQHVQVRLELIHPSPNPRWTPGSSLPREIPASTVRCARVLMPDNPLPGTTLRLVALHSYYFWVSVTPPDVDTDSLHAGLPGKLVPPNRRLLSVTSKRGMLEVHERWLSNLRANASMHALRSRSGA